MPLLIPGGHDDPFPLVAGSSPQSRNAVSQFEAPPTSTWPFLLHLAHEFIMLGQQGLQGDSHVQIDNQPMRVEGLGHGQ